jgi:hypothetical protein
MGGASRLRRSPPTGQECPCGQVDLPPSLGRQQRGEHLQPCLARAVFGSQRRRGRLRRHFGDRFIVGKFRISDAFGRTPLTVLVFWFRLPSWGFGGAFAVSGVGGRWPMRRWRSRVGQVFHLIEQPIDGICSGGPRPVSATCFIASKRSRRAFGIGVVREASSLPRYCNSSCALKPKKSGVH